jgi:hypothetical protein
MQLGSVYDGIANRYFVSLTTAAGVTHTSLDIVQESSTENVSSVITFTGINVDQNLAARFGGNSSYGIPGALTATLPGHYYDVSYGRGCANAAAGFPSGKCDYGGARWFVGPSPANNETKADPTAPGNQKNSSGTIPADFNNAGALTGVKTIYEHRAYQTVENLFRQFEGALGGAARAADFNVYWGAAGKVDSVIDVTHNVVVPFAADHIADTWGILNQAATTAGGSFDTRPADLTIADWACVEPLRSFGAVGAAGGLYTCTAPAPVLSNTVALGSIALAAGNSTTSATNSVKTAPARANGFSMYLPGHVFFFEMAAATPPAAGTVWTMRGYTGAISGGHGGGGGDEGNYAFRAAIRPFTASGAEVRFSFGLTNELLAASKTDLNKVHTVPDPYYVTSEFEQTTDTKVIKFVNLPNDAIIRIYSSSGVLVDLLEHHSTQFGGSEDWNVRNRNNQVVASGVYFYHIESGDARRVGRFTIVNFAQ